MTTLVRAFLSAFDEFHRAHGASVAVKHTLAALRVLAFPRLLRDMSVHGYLGLTARKQRGDGEPVDPFHFISHGAYLAQGLPLAKRFEAALHHHRHEASTFDDAFLNQVYGEASTVPWSGFLLWSTEVDGHEFEIRLRQAGDNFLEGDLCLVLLTDGVPVGSMGFVWADAALLGQAAGPSLFVTRNQTHTWPELAVFRACFKQNSPPYFCLAALAGLAQASGMREIYGIHHAHQLSYQPKYETGFRNSYTEFWEKFGGERIEPYAYRLGLPLELNDLSLLKSKHRSRAEGRRRHWAEIGQRSAEVVARHRLGAASPASAEEPARPAKAVIALALACEALDFGLLPAVMPLV